MYHDLIRSELNEAADTLAKFLSDDANIDTIQRAAVLLAVRTALGANRIVAVGALVFFVSDTLLGFKMFWPGFSLWQADFLIMLAYITGQGLIALGSVRHAQRSVGDAVPA